jgi:hypothetical protein
MESNWDPEVKKFFVKILNSISLGLFWMISAATTGIYLRLAYFDEKPVIYTILFYVIAAATLYLLIRYLYNLWK